MEWQKKNYIHQKMCQITILSNSPYKEDVIVIWHIFGGWSWSEKLSDIKPPFTNEVLIIAVHNNFTTIISFFLEPKLNIFLTPRPSSASVSCWFSSTSEYWICTRCTCHRHPRKFTRQKWLGCEITRNPWTFPCYVSFSNFRLAHL